jgi:hypothetical protein
MFLHTKIYQGTKWIYGGEQMTIAIQMLMPLGKKKRKQAHNLNQNICVTNHGHYGYRDIFSHRMLKETYTTLSMTRKQQRPGDCETYIIPRISMYQLDVKPQKAPIYHDESGS